MNITRSELATSPSRQEDQYPRQDLWYARFIPYWSGIELAEVDRVRSIICVSSL